MTVVYGTVHNDVEEAAKTIGAALGVDFEGHDSSFYDGAYYLAGVSEGRIRIQRSGDLEDDPEPLYSQRRRSQVLLVFEGDADADWRPRTSRLTALFDSRQVLRDVPRCSLFASKREA